MDDNTTKTDLARRAVNCKAGRWMPGMRRMNGDACIAVESDGRPIFAHWADHDGGGLFYCADSKALPDLDDPATLGCLLALVRDAWIGWVIEVVVSSAGAAVRVTDINGVGGRRFAGSTLAPCLVAALEAAP